MEKIYYYDFAEKMRKPVTDEMIEKMAMDLYNWSRKKNSYILLEFLAKLPITRTTFYKLVEQYEMLDWALDKANCWLACRREERASKESFFKVYDKTIAVYDYEYREMLVWRESIKTKHEGMGNAPTINVVIDKFPSSTVVPDRTDVSLKQADA